jgi:uncharacterized membrane protein YsdA (DUF1294 family)
MNLNFLWVYLAAINVIALIVCVYDKQAAIKKRGRISEAALFVISIIGGAAGVLAGMLLVRHKTKQWRFVVFVPLLIAVHVALLVLWVV